MSPDVKSELAPTGVLRAGINLSNFLLVTGKSAAGDPEGVAPDMAREIAARLGVPVKYVPYKTPGELADMAGTGAWDIGLIGAEPQRAEKIAFTAAYVEIEATYLVPAGSPPEGDRRRRPRRRAHRRDGPQRLRPLARPQHQAGPAGALGHARQRARAIHPRQAGCARGSAAAAAVGCDEAAGRAHPRRPVHRRAAGHRHGPEELGRRRVPARASSRRRRRRGSSPASSSATRSSASRSRRRPEAHAVRLRLGTPAGCSLPGK